MIDLTSWRRWLRNRRDFLTGTTRRREWYVTSWWMWLRDGGDYVIDVTSWPETRVMNHTWLRDGGDYLTSWPGTRVVTNCTWLHDGGDYVTDVISWPETRGAWRRWLRDRRPFAVYRRTSRAGALQVDGEDLVNGTSPFVARSLNVAGPIFIGMVVIQNPREGRGSYSAGIRGH